MRGDTVQIRLVGVNVDNRADGKGKAGLTFMTTTYVSEIDTNVANTRNNAGGYRDVRIRKDYNEGQYKSTISNNVYQHLTPVLKIQDNQANGEMNNWQHSATSNSIVEKVSIPSPLELNMNVTKFNFNNYYNGLTPTGTKQYNSHKHWYSYYNYLYSGNASYEYYQNNTNNISKYCELARGNGLYKDGWQSCQGVPDSWRYIWLRTPISKDSDFFADFDSDDGTISGHGSSYSNHHSAIVLLSF